jgi:hypothetical protein
MTTAYITKRKKLATKIIDEHFEMTLVANRNINYLWYTYKTGTKRGEFRPFIFLSELNLLVKTGYITEDEKQNMLGMLVSDDDDNAHLTGYSILTLRKKRIDNMGLWTLDNKKYEKLNYTSDIINPEFFTNQL